MPLWDKVKQELDRAGKVAQEAIDEGRIRIEQVRARQLADKAAQRLGYAYGRARTEGRSVDDDPEITRLQAALTEHEAEATRLEAELAVITRRTPRPESAGDASTESASHTGGSASSSGAAAGSAAGGATGGAADVDSDTTTDFGGNSGAAHRPDGSMYTGGAATGGTAGSTGGTASTHDAPGAPPAERNEWNREHL